MIETHPLPPFLPQNASVLLLGSFPPAYHRWRMDFYYSNFNNDMWRIMGLVFYDDAHYFIDSHHRCFYLDQIQAFLRAFGIAISDTAYQVVRLNDTAADKFLRVVHTQAIDELLMALPDCQAIITTGELATQILLDELIRLGALPAKTPTPKVGACVDFCWQKRSFSLYRLPSSSRAYPLPIAKKAEQYRLVFERLGLLSGQ